MTDIERSFARMAVAFEAVYNEGPAPRHMTDQHRGYRSLQVAECSCGYKGKGHNFDVRWSDVIDHIVAAEAKP